jgi:hypothetical protein
MQAGDPSPVRFQPTRKLFTHFTEKQVTDPQITSPRAERVIVFVAARTSSSPGQLRAVLIRVRARSARRGAGQKRVGAARSLSVRAWVECRSLTRNGLGRDSSRVSSRRGRQAQGSLRQVGSSLSLCPCQDEQRVTDSDRKCLCTSSQIASSLIVNPPARPPT